MADQLSFDPLDDTKIWPENQFPFQKVGMMVLNENPKNFFTDIEQAAFCPANIVPGIEFSADKMLQGRTFSYTDTQRYRIGANFAQLPVNRPVSPVANDQQDGYMAYKKSARLRQLQAKLLRPQQSAGSPHALLSWHALSRWDCAALRP